MVKITNVNSVPASFVEIAPQTDGRYTRAMLDVFYVGETQDHRCFTKSFSDALLQTIAYTPVVSHYDESRQEFDGHAAQQEVYGVVDPMVPPTYVDHDGATWARCEVILFTQRPDKVGEIAAKIVGHAQSLELDPDTLKYKINRDRHGNFKNLEFLQGEFVGVSVLGSDQEPAFTGSQFFEQLIPEVFARGKEMTLTIQEFAKLSWGEKATFIANALYAKYGDDFWCIRDIYDNNVVYDVYDAEEQRIRLFRCKYKLDGEVCTLTSEPEEVHPTYEALTNIDLSQAASRKRIEEDNEDIALEQESSEGSDGSDGSEGSEGSEGPEGSEGSEGQLDNGSEGSEGQLDNGSEGAEGSEGPAADPAEPVENPGEAEVQSTPEPVDNGGEVSQASTLEDGVKGSTYEETPTTTTSALSYSERIELEAYRKEKKIELINSYADAIGAEDLKKFVDQVDSYEFQALKSELDALFVAAIRNKARAEAPAAPAASFKWYPSTPKTGTTNELANYIGELLRK